MALVWENLSCDGDGSFCEKLFRGCRTNKKKKQILTDLNGYLKFGELTALMGPSGAGKSTLLNCLMQGNRYVGTHGRIAVASKWDMRSVLITQNDNDHLLLNLTVFESLYYASELKNPFNTTRLEHTIIVKQLLEELDLTKVENIRVVRCSGGQKKRIAIGLELTALIKPNFLFLDEPLSGLDSHSGFNVVYRLRNLAQQLNIAVVTVIHQPSFEIFSQYHNVYILSKAGRCIFSGSPKLLQEHLNNYNYQSTNSNPADIIISIASCVSKEDDEIVDPIDVEEGNDNTGTIKKADEMKRDCEEMTLKLAQNWQNNSYANSGVEIQRHGLRSSGAEFKLYSLWVLLKRTSITSLFRQKRLIFIRLALHLVVAAVLAALYDRQIGAASDCYINIFQNSSIEEQLRSELFLDQDVKFKFFSTLFLMSEKELQKENIPNQNVKFQFFSILFLMFAALMPTVLTFSAEIKLFINEHRNGWYSTPFYYISKTLMEIPFQLIFSFCYTYFLYWYSNQIDMNDWYNGIFGWMPWRYGYFLGIIILSCFIAQGLGFLIGIICVNSFPMAIILSSTVLLFQFLFSGFFVRIVDMHSVTKGITHLSFVRFSFESLMIILYGENRCKYPFKSAIMFTFNLDDANLLRNLFWILGHLIATRILAFILLLKLANPKIISTSLSCAFLFDSILPRIKQTRRYLGKFVFVSWKVFALVFAFHLVVGASVLISVELKKNNTHAN